MLAHRTVADDLGSQGDLKGKSSIRKSLQHFEFLMQLEKKCQLRPSVVGEWFQGELLHLQVMRLPHGQEAGHHTLSSGAVMPEKKKSWVL